MLVPSPLTRLMQGSLIICLLFSGCTKEDSDHNREEDKQAFIEVSTEADIESQGIFDNVFNDVIGVNDEVGLGGTGIFGGANHNSLQGELINTRSRTDSNQCFTVTITRLVTGSPFPVKVVVDFGNGCTGKDGKNRKGKVITEYSNRLIVPGAIATTHFDGYSVDEVKVEGILKISNRSTQDKRIFHVIVTNGKLTHPNGNFSLWNSEKTITQVEGLGTPFFPMDDVFEITGGANGSVKNGDRYFQWSTLITEPLTKKFNCRWIVSGQLSLRKNDAPVTVVNFGQGACDNKAFITVNGQTIEFTLH
ncbi:MAG TPA: hypothetical protein VM012_06330 [Flavitalea sp.]|nr:hypothetical protein [Flavitalea sp.]